MSFKRKINWLCFIGVVELMLISCACSSKENRAAPPVDNANRVNIDSSLWLEEARGIRDILEDNNGNLWFASSDYVAKLDGKTINYFSEDEGLKIVGNLHKDATGTIWVENGFKLFWFNGTNFIEETLEDNVVAKGLMIQRALRPTDSIYVAPGVYDLNADYPKFLPFPVVKADNNKYLYFPTTKAYLGKDSTLWFGTMEKVFGLKNGLFTSIGREEMGRENDPRNMGVRGIFVDSKGVLWIADNGAGVFRYDGKTVENFTQKYNLDEGDVEGNSLHRAFSIAEDTLGNMWFGTVYSGIWRFNPNSSEFENFAKNEGVNSENIWTIYKTKRGQLFFAGESPAAVYTFNGKTFDRIY